MTLDNYRGMPKFRECTKKLRAGLEWKRHLAMRVKWEDRAWKISLEAATFLESFHSVG